MKFKDKVKLNSKEYKESKEYWTNKIIPYTKSCVLDLPTDSTIQFTEIGINDDLLGELNKKCKEDKIQLFVYLSSCLNLLVHKYVQEDHIQIGAHKIYGNDFLLNSRLTILNSSYDDNQSFKHYFSTQIKEIENVLQNQHYPIETLLSEIAFNTPDELFELFFNFEDISECKANSFDFPIVISFSFENKKLTLANKFKESEQYFSNNLLTHFLFIIKQTLEDETIRLGQISVLTGIEKNKLFELSKINSPYHHLFSIAELFEQQVKKTPSKTALIFNNIQFSYQDLNDISNKFAQYLKDKKIASGSCIGVELDKSTELIIALLAIIKIGCTYVPLALSLPAKRKLIIKEDTHSIITINSDTFVDFESKKDGFSSRFDSEKIALDSLAYIMYTSGSTGIPKGVMVTHRNVVRLVKADNYVHLTGNEVILSTGDVMFDATTFEFWGALLNGGTLVICPQDVLLSPKLLHEEISKTKITTAFFTTGLFNQIINSDIRVFSNLQTILTGGEMISISHVRKLNDTFNHLNIIHVYGPTENTTFSTFYFFNPSSYTIPIGKAIANSSAYILGAKNQLCPVGVLGEICLGGEGVAKGYLNDPILTSQKFIANPFLDNDRLYKSGDLGKWLPDGNIEIIGRKDQQTKIHGYRIELNEVKQALLKHDSIKDAELFVNGDSSKNKELIAFIILLDNNLKINFKEYLLTHLPAFMIPSQFINLEEFPLNQNKKVDQRELKKLVLNNQISLSEKSDLSDTQKKLISIWKSILNINYININDNFFDLGGHSLKALEIIVAVSEIFKIDISISTIFENVTLAELSSKIDELSILSKAKEVIVPLSEPAEFYPLSPQQRRIWLIAQEESGSRAYNMPSVFSLKGSLDVKNFISSFHTLVERHESLRTVFVFVEGVPKMKILDPGQMTNFIRFYDHTNTDEQATEELIHNHKTHLFDLEHGPLIKIDLIKKNEQQYFLLLNVHHIIFDGISFNVMFNDVSKIYSQKRNNVSIDLELLKFQYKDYVNCFFRENDALAEEFWKAQLFELPAFEMPYDRPRKTKKSYNGNVFSSKINATISNQLRNLAKEENTTLYTSLLTSFNLLIHNVFNIDDYAISTAVTERNKPGFKNQIGFFVNTILLRFKKTNGTQSFRDYLNVTKQLVSGCIEHYNYPIDQLLSNSNNQNDNLQLFNLMFSVQMDEFSVSEFEGIKIEALTTESVSSKFDLLIYFSDNNSGEIKLNVEYNSDLFYASTIESMFSILKTIIQSVALNPDQSIDQIEGLSTIEKEKVLYLFNDTISPYPTNVTIAELFEDQVQKTPDNIAVIANDNEYTYKQINEESNQLADYLRKTYDIQPDDLLGIKLENTEKLIVTILATLKSGGAYVPIDSSYPLDRIDYMLQDCKCKVLIDAAELEKFEKKKDNYSKHNFSTNTQSNNLAYVIYTSGSTGRPKGVMIEQKSVVRLVKNVNYIEVVPEDRILNLSNFSFDGSVFDLFMPLLNGAAMVISSKGTFLDLSQLNKLIEEKNISSFFITTALFNSVVDSALSSLGKLKYLLFGGELVSINHVNKFKKLYPQVNLHHVYGPTENTTFSTWYRVGEVMKEELTIPIGSPLSNSEIYIFNDRLKPLPIGIVGEIYVGGEGLARGYLNNSDLTAQKFIDYPSIKGGKLYKTGDLGKWLPNGNIEFIARRDDQVKIRGHRIEPGEIENALQNHASINEAVVIVKENEIIEKVLIAYIVSNDQIDISVLKDHLKQVLPEYMIPFRFIQINNLPLTRNGKVDRKALSDMQINTDSTCEFIAPRNPSEEQLLKIWKDIFKHNEIGVQDNFFELGGHSLKMSDMVLAINQRMGKNISIKDIIENPTIEGISHKIMSKDQHTLYPSIISDRNNRQKSFPLTQVQLAYLWGRQEQFELGGGSTHGYGEMELDIDVFKLETAINKLILRHPMLHTIFNFNGTQRILEDVPLFKIKYTDLTHHSEHEQENYIQQSRKEMSHHNFQIDKWPLFDVKVLKLKENLYKFFYEIDPLIMDTTSILIIQKELLQFYNDPNLELSEIEIGFREYILGLEELKKTDIYLADKDYWLKKLDSIPERPVIQLKEDPSTITNPTFTRKYDLINAEDWKLIQKFCKINKVTPTALFATAYMETLSRWSNQSKLSINLTVTNRLPLHPDINNIVGDFTSIIILEGDLQIGGDIWDKIKDVQGTLWEAINHKHYDGIEFIREYAKANNLGTQTVFPYVMTSALSIENGLSNQTAGKLDESYKNSITQTSQVYIDNKAMIHGEDVLVEWDYVRELFDEEMIESMFNYYVSAIKATIQPKLTETTDIMISRSQKSYNKTHENIPHTTLTDLLRNTVAIFPNEIALKKDNVTYSYKQLEEFSNKVANYLILKGIQKGNTVGVLGERIPESIGFIYGVLKAGGVYLPIDPSYPLELKNYILEISDCKLLLASEHLADIKKTVISPILTKVLPSDIAYVIFTSGSTGKPKGVVIEHLAACNTIIDINQKFNVSKTDKIIALSSFSFDLSIYDIFGATERGACLVLIEDQRDAKNVLKILKEEKITIWNSVPAIMDLVSNELDFEESQKKPLYWSDFIDWNNDESDLIINGRSFHEEKILFPEFYFFIQNGKTSLELLFHFHFYDQSKLLNFIKQLIAEGVLSHRPNDLKQKFSYYARLYGQTDKQVMFDKDFYREFKIRQFQRVQKITGKNKIDLAIPDGVHDQLENRRSGRVYSAELFSVEPLEKSITKAYSSYKNAVKHIHVYMFVKADRVNGLAEGFYKFDIDDNRIHLLKKSALKSSAFNSLNLEIYNSSAFVMFFVGEKDSNYSEQNLVDAGCLSAAIMWNSHEYCIGSCYIGNLNDTEIRKKISLPDGHEILTTLTGGIVNTHENAKSESTFELQIKRSSQPDFSIKLEQEDAKDYYYWSLPKMWEVNNNLLKIAGDKFEPMNAEALLSLHFLSKNGCTKEELLSKLSFYGDPENLLSKLVDADIIGSKPILANDSVRVGKTKSKGELSLEMISSLLGCFTQNKKKNTIKYKHPSAGGLYPIDVYIRIPKNGVSGLAGGTYYVNPATEQLIMTDEEITSFSIAIEFVYNPFVNVPKYGDYGIVFAYIETGIMRATLQTVADKLNIQLSDCFVGNMFKDNDLKPLASILVNGSNDEVVKIKENAKIARSDKHTLDLRLVMLSGDWIPLDLPLKIKHHIPNCELISLGGATEASIWSIYYPIKHMDGEWKSIPYGYPLANQTIYVLDYNLKTCPVGVKGDIYIGGIGVAKEYLNRPDLTASSFIETHTYGRIYRTGDKGKFVKDGYVEFLGREDEQVKINGYRIELTAVEVAFQNYKPVSMVKVLAPYTNKFQRELVCFLKLEGEIQFDEIRNYLSDRIPQYMIPNHFIKVQEFPMTNNGKINSKLLLNEVNVSEVKKIIRIAETKTEKTLSAILEVLLSKTMLDIDSSFFSLGANSITLTKIINEIEMNFSLRITFREILEKDTISKLSQLIDDQLIVKEMDELLSSIESSDNN